MHYTVIFDAAASGYRYGWFNAGSLFVAAVVVGAMYLDQKFKARPRFRFPFLLVGLCLLWSVGSLVPMFSDYWHLRQALRTGQFQSVEGRVSHFVPQPEGDHGEESFTVSGHTYSYSYATLGAGFNRSHTHGGPIREGLPVRIADVDGMIARLEVSE